MNKLKEYRLKRGVSQEAVSKAIGVSRKAVNQWENGVHAPRDTNIYKLAAYYQLDPIGLLRTVHGSKD